MGQICDRMNPDFSLINPFGPPDGAEQSKQEQGWLMRFSKIFLSQVAGLCSVGFQKNKESGP